MGRSPIDGVWLSNGVPVQACSWTSFSDSPGDHRAAIVDFDLVALLGQPRLKVCRPPARRLVCTLLATRDRYIALLTAFLEKHQFLSKLYKLYTSTDPRSPHLHSFSHTYEHLDHIRIEGMRYAEKRCRRLRMGLLAYSPTLMLLRHRQTLWSLVCKKKSGGSASVSRIQRLARRCDVDRPLSVSLRAAQENFSAAQSEYFRLKPQSMALREDYLRARLADPFLSDEMHLAAQRQLALEKQCNDFRLIRHTLGGSPMQSVHQVETTQGSDTILHASRAAMEYQLRTAFEKHFQLAAHTPLLQEPLASQLGSFGDSAAAESVLNGSFVCPPEVDAFTRHFLQTLQRPRAHSQISLEISCDDFISYWHRARERTSSSLSGAHFGHYKAAASSLFLAEIHALMTQLPYTVAYTPRRWQAGLQVVLQKKAGVIHVDRLRAILLFEGDFNFGNKVLFGRRMTDSALRQSLVPFECFGSVPGKRATQVSLARCWIADLS